MEGGAALNSPAQSRSRRPLTILAYALGTLAALLVLATLVLLAVDGHPEGLFCLVAGAAVPVLLWGAGRLAQLAHSRLWSPGASRARDAAPLVSTDLEVTGKAELNVVLEDTSPPSYPSATILVRLGWT